MIKKKVLDSKHTLIFTSHFPYNTQRRKGQYQALLGIGGNIGDVLRRFEHLFWYFERSKMLHILETAPIYKNPPFGYTQQSDFYNSVILIETKLLPKALLRYVLRVEKLYGRKRSFQDAPRTLDIDILFYEDVVMQTKELTLPHHGWMSRSSVLVPLSYIRKRRFT
jgi:2-amino-4-hydroxy-6-hydroxymethyldihydropteridine diphosphokinase